MTQHKHWRQHTDALAQAVGQKPFGLITDIDGTISPIAPTPEAAYVTDAARDWLRRLQPRVTLVAAVTGRTAADGVGMLDLPGVVVVGSHGLERWHDGQTTVHEEARPYLQAIQKALDGLAPLVAAHGMTVQSKGVTATLHYRNAPGRDKLRDKVYPQITAIARQHGLEVFGGRYMFELHPPIAVDKGTALTGLVAEFKLNGVLFMGDDVTDLNAFGALYQLRDAGRVSGFALGVASDETPSQIVEAADFRLDGVEDVERFLEWLLDNVG